MRFFIIFFIDFSLNTSIFAEQSSDNSSISFFDVEDKMLDLSEYLSQAYGFLPVPIIITEPSVGYGGGAALVFLHDKFAGKKTSTGRNIPPSISGIILAATENNTKIGGGFHLGHYFEDNLRTQTFVLQTDVNIDLYTKRQNPIFFNFKGPVAYQSLKLRILDSNIFLGAAYLFIKTDVSNIDNDNFNLPEKHFKNAALGFIFDYDNRDNTLSPNKGMIFNFRANFFDKSFGGDESFQKYFLQELLYLPITKKLNFDHRLIYDQISGKDAPFYMYPSPNMRGLPLLKYQGEKVALYETQLRWEFYNRFSILGFVGFSKSFGKTNGLIRTKKISFQDADTQITRGIGFRYLIAKKFGLRMGIDLAFSDEDTAVYVQVGSAWMGF
jgi:hypothetical protein